MHNYDSLKLKFGRKVSQTLDSPIKIFNMINLGDAFIGLAIILIFGVIFYSWGSMLLLLLIFCVFVPQIKKKTNKGIFYHWPYKNFNISLPGLVNPEGRKKFSD